MDLYSPPLKLRPAGPSAGNSRRTRSTQPTLTKSGLTDEPNHLSVAVSGMRERRFQRVHFCGTANETRQAARYGYVEPAAHTAAESCDLTVLDLEPQADYPSPLASRGVVGMARDGVE